MLEPRIQEKKKISKKKLSETEKEKLLEKAKQKLLRQQRLKSKYIIEQQKLDKLNKINQLMKEKVKFPISQKLACKNASNFTLQSCSFGDALHV